MLNGASAGAVGEPADPRLADHMLGDAKAPVSIDEYFSLGCPHCADFDLEMLPKLKADYIDKGKLKFIFHDFPLNEISLQAAMLARCAPNDRYFPDRRYVVPGANGAMGGPAIGPGAVGRSEATGQIRRNDR